MTTETPERPQDPDEDETADEVEETGEAPTTRQVTPSKTGDVRPNR